MPFITLFPFQINEIKMARCHEGKNLRTRERIKASRQHRPVYIALIPADIMRPRIGIKNQ